MLDSMPDDMEAWEEYFAIYQAGLLMEPPSVKEANEFYKRNRKKLDKGAKATWKQRHKPNEVSAIQHAMNLYCRNPVTFFAEYQNDPIGKDSDIQFLKAKEISEKQHNYARFEVPLEVQKITAFVDVQKELLIYIIVGWSNDFSGYVLDYGTFPEQKRLSWVKAKIPITLTSKYPKHTEKSRIYQAIADFHQILSAVELRRQGDGALMKIDRIGVDSRYQTSTIRRCIRDSKDPLLVPTMGGNFGATEKPMNHPDNVNKWTSGGRRLGTHWRQGEAKSGVQTVEVSPNFWKTFVQEGLATPLGSVGSISLFKQERQFHNLFASHLTAEYRTQVENKYGKVDVWKVKPGNPDNDWLDCLVGSAVIANFDGIETVGVHVEHGSKNRKKLDSKKWGGSK